MSQDTIAIFDVATPQEPNALAARLASEPALAALVPRYGAAWEATAWSVAPSASDDRVLDVIGPGGVVLRLGRRSVEVYHLLPFKRFAGEESERRVLRRMFRTVARLVGSKRAVYTHELAHTDRDPDAGTEEVIKNLADAVGPAASTFEELAGASPYRARSWYVDDFADLDAN